MNARTDQIRLSAPLSLLAPSPGSRLPARFVGIAYTGGLVPSYGIVIDLASTTVAASMPLLSEHRREQIVGKVDDAGVRNGQIVVAGSIYSDMPGSQAERIAQLAQRGTSFQMSVGLFNFSEELVPQGVTATVNGAHVPGPVTVLRNGSVRECSVVTIGADPHTSVELFGQPNSRDRQIRQLFAEIGEPLAGYERQMLNGLSDTAFRAFSERLRQLAAKVKATRSLSIPHVYGKRREQASRWP